ncbi:MAG TPA: DUF72 domain-containing protein [Cyclobacteriaceae bacterium]|nr:DUF72 domain-containing protein [Cyclobacteriaceae bacterium]
MNYRIGCSGYYYPQWRNTFYPKGLAPKNWLAHYSSTFNTVEMNGTFYRQPKTADLKKYAVATSDEFTFSVKMSRYITHVQRLKEKQAVTTFQDLILDGLGPKLQHFLFQMPPTFKYSDENLESIINTIPHEPQNVIEFRHISWWNESVRQALASANITFCNVDFPGLDSWFIHTSPAFYLRLHGSPQLFVTPYDESRLENFYRQFPATAQRCSVYFNNTVTEAGFQNAMTMRKIVQDNDVLHSVKYVN